MNAACHRVPWNILAFLVIVFAILISNHGAGDLATAPLCSIEAPCLVEDAGIHTITAYCSCPKCCGKWAENRPDGIVYGAHGIELQEGVSVASPLPAGTVINIEGLGQYTVHDRTADWIVSRYGGRIVDVYFRDHEAARAFGKQSRGVMIVSGLSSRTRPIAH